MNRDEDLEELRLIFRGEVDDHVLTLEREVAKLGTDEAESARASREIYRAVHSLKGASRAVGVQAIEEACHRLETLLGSESLSAAEVSELAKELALALRDWLTTGSEGRFSMLAGEGPGRPVEAELAPISLRERVDRALPDPESLHSERPPSEAPGSRSARETTRVSVATLGFLAEASEELLGLSVRSVYEAKPLEDTLAALRTDLARVRDGSRRSGSADVESAAERALSTLQTLRLLLSADQERVESWRRAIAFGARALVGRARELRVVPLAALAPGLERAAEELALALGKHVRLEVDLDRAEVDRTVRDGLRGVLLHLVRNAIDHGIEPPNEREAMGKPVVGTVRISAEIVGRELRVVVTDDGRGLAREKLLETARRLGLDTERIGPSELWGLIFEPGFTTASALTAVSGRGMGLDIVRQSIGQLHGRVDVEPNTESGTRFRLLVPVDLSVLRGVVVSVGEAVAVLPTASVLRLRRVAHEAIRSIEGRAYVTDDHSVLPLVKLGALLRWERPVTATRERDSVLYAVVGAAERVVALEVDAFNDVRELVVHKPSEKLRGVPFLAGLTVLDAGSVAVVLDVHDIVSLGRARSTPQRAELARRARILVVDDSITTRQLVRSILEAAGYEIAVAADGGQAWNMLGESEVDVVVSDVDMPRIDGFQLLARIRNDRRLSKLPVILVTALAQDEDRRRAFDLGASAYIVKAGFDQDELLNTIEELLE